MNAIRRCLFVSSLCLATAVHAQSTEVTGEVMNVFGDRFVLQTGGGPVLVAAPPTTPPLQPGQRVTVSGERDGNQITAEKIRSATSGRNATAEDALPEALRGLGLIFVDSREWPHGKREYLLQLDGGTRIEVEIDRDGNVQEIEAEGHKAVMPASLLGRFVPESVARHPQLNDLENLHKIEISNDGEIEIEGFFSSGERFDAEFDASGRLVDFDLH